jgi:nitrogen fixation NifU-like protein
MAELADLYQELVLEHSKHPRNFRALDHASHQAEGYNPLCGDHFTVYLEVEGDVIREVSFQGSGCAISKASASIMTQALKGRTTSAADELFEKFHRVVTGADHARAENLGKLAAFAGVSEFPTRVKCATLAWHTLRAALTGEQQAVSTE